MLPKNRCQNLGTSAMATIDLWKAVKLCFYPRKGKVFWILEKGKKDLSKCRKNDRKSRLMMSNQNRLKYVAFLHIVCTFCEHLQTLYVGIQTSSSEHCNNSSLLGIGVQPQHTFLPPTPKKNIFDTIFCTELIRPVRLKHKSEKSLEYVLRFILII